MGHIFVVGSTLALIFGTLSLCRLSNPCISDCEFRMLLATCVRLTRPRGKRCRIC
jgi:hypothetical protein